jgi:superfamily II DNA/RNA helicase
MLPPLARTKGGVVIFTQFLATQREIASRLARMGTVVRLINGQTPPHERQPITDAFRREGGFLVLTQSGTEGRNLQFCHRLVNFDLPWNPKLSKGSDGFTASAKYILSRFSISSRRGVSKHFCSNCCKKN